MSARVINFEQWLENNQACKYLTQYYLDVVEFRKSKESKPIKVSPSKRVMKKDNPLSKLEIDLIDLIQDLETAAPGLVSSKVSKCRYSVTITGYSGSIMFIPDVLGVFGEKTGMHVDIEDLQKVSDLENLLADAMKNNFTTIYVHNNKIPF